MTTEQNLGMRLNNPTDLRHNPAIKWDGQIGQEQGFCSFKTMQKGLNAGAKNLAAKQKRHGLVTPQQIIGDETWGWAPASDHNNVEQYVNGLCLTFLRVTGRSLAPSESVNLMQRSSFIAFLKGIVREEQGDAAMIITDEMYEIAADIALGGSMIKSIMNTPRKIGEAVTSGGNTTTVGESLKSQLIAMGFGAQYIEQIETWAGVAHTAQNHIILYGIISQVMIHIYLWFKKNLGGLDFPKA